MKNQKWITLTSCLMGLVIGSWIFFNSRISKAQNKNVRVKCEWVTESATEFYYSGTTGRYEPRYVTKQVYKCAPVSEEAKTVTEDNSTKSKACNECFVRRKADGTFSPPDGYRWVYLKESNNTSIKTLELMPNLVTAGSGLLRPASGYQWDKPADDDDFTVKLVPGLVKTKEGFRPAPGYRWFNANDAHDLRVERIP